MSKKCLRTTIAVKVTKFIVIEGPAIYSIQPPHTHTHMAPKIESFTQDVKMKAFSAFFCLIFFHSYMT